MKRILNWGPSFKHHLDARYDGVVRDTKILPATVDLREQSVPIFDQGQMGSCSGNALAAHYGFLQLKAGKPLWTASRLFIYYNERLKEGDPGEDGGATTLRDGCVSLYGMGVCSEDVWAYTESNLFVKPPQSAYGAAESNKIHSFVSLNSMQDRKHCLASGYPWVFGIPIYSSFESNSVAESGVIPMPGWLDRAVGGHALLCIGYDDESQMYLFQNSWGTDWGDEGLGYIPYQYIETMGDDFYTLRLGA